MILVNGAVSQSVPATDRGLAYGDGVFRTLAMRRGVPEQWHRHYQKLAHDCAALDLDCPPLEVLAAEVGQLANKVPDAAVKIIVTRGAGERGYRYERSARHTHIMMTVAMPQYSEACRRAGVKVRRCRLKLANQPALAGIKHLNRLENVLARAEWRDPEIVEGLLCDTDDCVIGGTMTNVFAAMNGTLVTPELNRCGVAGVTRDRVMALAGEHGLQCQVRDLKWDELAGADEIFLLNSLIGLLPVCQIEGRRRSPGELTRSIQQWLEQERDASLA